MEVKIQEYNNIMDLEFGLLRELPKLKVLNSLKNDDDKENKLFSDIKDNLKKITYTNDVFEVIEEVDDGFICFNNNDGWKFIKGCMSIKIGDIYCNNDNDICKINEELIDDKKFKELFVEIDKWAEKGEEDSWGRRIRNYEQKNLIRIKDIKKGEITSEMILNLLKEHKKKVEAEEKKREKIKKEEEKIKEAKESDEEKIYGVESKGVFSDYSVSKNIIKGVWSQEFILDKDVNKIFSYEQIKNLRYLDTILSNVELFLLDKKTTYTKIKSGDEKYKVVYTDGKCKIDGINIPFSKQKFILNRLNTGSDKKDIKILLKLNGMKADFVSLVDLRYTTDSLNILIKNIAIDDKTFKIEFIDKTKTFNWDEIKDLFFYSDSRSLRNGFGNEKLLNFCNIMNVPKKDLFENLRRLKILKGLEDSNEN